jgi:autotransporter-associated beta strand protein
MASNIKKKNSLALKKKFTQLVFWTVCLLVQSSVFGQNWNFYYRSDQMSLLANSLASGNVSLSTSSSSTNGGIDPVYGRGDIVFSGALSYSNGNARTLTLTSSEDIWINGDITSTGGALSLVFNAPAGKKILINGDITTNGGSITVNNGTPVHFQKTSGVQTINTNGGSMSFGSSALKLLNTGGSLVLNSGAGALTLGSSGTIVQEGTFYQSPTRLLDWGGRHSSNSGITEKDYGIWLTSGRAYAMRLYYWDSWDGEGGEIFIRNGTTSSSTFLSYVFRAQRNSTGIYNINPSGATYTSTLYQTSTSSNLGVASYQDQYVDLAMTTSFSGYIKTWNNLDQHVDDESLELYNLWETSFSTTTYNSGARTLEFITTNTTQDACLISGVISGGLNLINSGAGKITFNGNSTYTGTTTISAGTTYLGNNSTTGTFGTGAITNNGAIIVNRSNDLTIANAISGTGTLTKQRANVLTLTQNNTYSGSTTISEGTTQIGNNSTTGTFGTGAITNNGVIIVNRSNDLTIANAISGSGSLTKIGSGILTLAGNHTYLGGTTVDAGTLKLEDTAPSDGNGVIVGTLNVNQNGTVELTGLPASLGWTSNRVTTLNIHGGSVTTNNVAQHIWNMTGGVNFNGGGTLMSNAGTSSSTANSYFEWNGSPVTITNPTQPAVISGRVNLRNDSPNSNITFTINDGEATNDLLFSAAITQSGAVTFTKAGPGQMTLTGTNSNNAVTTINEGTLVLQNDNPNPTNKTFNGTGQLRIEPASTSFSSAFSTAGWTFNSTLTGLTLGKTNNATNITIGTATSVNGPITLHGGDLTLTAGLTTTNNSTGNITLNGTKLLGAGAIALATGRTLTANLSGDCEFTGDISGTTISFTKTGAGILTLNPTNTLTFSAATLTTGGLTIAATKQLTVNGTLTNNAALTLKDGATFVQAATTSMTGAGTYNVEKALTGNTSSWSNTSGRFWYMGVPMKNVARNNYGTPGTTTNRVWSYAESTKSYTEVTDGSALLSAGTGYVYRRSTDGTLTFTASGANGLRDTDFTASGLTKTTGHSAGYHLISNPFMAYIDWHAVTKTNIESTYYIRTNNSTNTNISALISYNQSTALSTNNSSVTVSAAQLQYIAPLQSIWVRVAGAAGSTGSLSMSRSMLSHQSGNVGLKSSTVFPNLARVNLVDGNNFDQLLVYLNGDMSNEVDEYDSEKMPVAGTVQVYTMSSNKKLVMNGLKNNKKKVSVPLYLELPETKSYTLQLSEYQVEDGLILIEDKQEGTIQDFTLMENYSFYANSGLLQNRFVLHFILPDAELAPQGPSNSWVAAEEGSYTEGGDVEISNDAKGNIAITLNQAAEQKVEGTVFVTDINGKEVYSGKLEGITTAIELDVPSGIYYLTVQSGTLIEKKKVFIQE